jgi:hypothetical protein
MIAPAMRVLALLHEPTVSPSLKVRSLARHTSMRFAAEADRVEYTSSAVRQFRENLPRKLMSTTMRFIKLPLRANVRVNGVMLAEVSVDATPK